MYDYESYYSLTKNIDLFIKDHPLLSISVVRLATLGISYGVLSIGIVATSKAIIIPASGYVGFILKTAEIIYG